MYTAVPYYTVRYGFGRIVTGYGRSLVTTPVTAPLPSLDRDDRQCSRHRTATGSRLPTRCDLIVSSSDQRLLTAPDPAGDLVPWRDHDSCPAAPQRDNHVYLDLRDLRPVRGGLPGAGDHRPRQPSGHSPAKVVISQDVPPSPPGQEPDGETEVYRAVPKSPQQLSEAAGTWPGKIQT